MTGTECDSALLHILRVCSTVSSIIVALVCKSSFLRNFLNSSTMCRVTVLGRTNSPQQALVPSNFKSTMPG